MPVGQYPLTERMTALSPSLSVVRLQKEYGGNASSAFIARQLGMQTSKVDEILQTLETSGR